MKRFLTITICFLAFSGTLAATGTKESPAGDPAVDSATTVRVGTLRGPTSVGMAPLLSEPERLGPEIDFLPRVFATPDLLVSQILAGEVDIAALPTNLAANLYNRRPDLQLLAVSGGGVLYVVARTPFTWEDLRGNTIHTLARGATPDILFQALARENGLEPGTDFEIRYSADQTELAQQLISGRVTLAVLPEPFVTRVVQANPELQVALDLGDSYRELYGDDTYPMTALAVSRSFADDHPRALDTFVEAYQQGLAWFRDNRERGAAEAADLIGIPAPIILDAYARLNTMFIPAGEAREAVERFLGIFYSANPRSIGGALPDSDFYH